MTTQENKQRLQGRRMLVLLLVLFALPIVIVLAMYKIDWRPGGASHGELIAPPKPLHVATQNDLQGKPFGAAQWKSKWHLVYVYAPGCTAACAQEVHMLRQVHVSLNQEIDRVQRVLLAPGTQDQAALAALQQRYPDLVILVGPAADTLTSQFDLPGQPAATSGRTYLVDPLGNLMMSYPAGHQPKGLRDDLMRLLKYSWVG